MPVLEERIPRIKQYYLPSSAFKVGDDGKIVAVPQEDQAWVKIDMGAITTGDVVVLSDDDTSTERLAKMIVGRILDWNYTEKDGTTPVPVTYENLLRLDAGDFRYLVNQQISSGRGGDAQLSTAEKKS